VRLPSITVSFAAFFIAHLSEFTFALSIFLLVCFVFGCFSAQVALKEEQAERARRLRRAAMEEEMLGDFVRLVDYMTVENLVLITLNTNQEFLETLQQPRKQGIFLTTLNFGSDAIEFAPTSEDVNQVFYTPFDHNICPVDASFLCRALIPKLELLEVLLAHRSSARRSTA
jgi:hypothetical protein